VWKWKGSFPLHGGTLVLLHATLLHLLAAGLVASGLKPVVDTLEQAHNALIVYTTPTGT
jgi:hypothetical protein